MGQGLNFQRASPFFNGWVNRPWQTKRDLLAAIRNHPGQTVARDFPTRKLDEGPSLTPTQYVKFEATSPPAVIWTR